MRRSITRALSVSLAAMLLVGLVGGTSAVAKKGQGKGKGKGRGVKLVNTKMRFKLDDHEVVVGEELTGAVRLTAGRGRRRTPVEGATLVVKVDGAEVATLVTDADGRADVAYTADVEGEHVMKVFFASDGTHRKAMRAQGFDVTAEPEREPEPELEPELDPEPESAA